MSVYVFVRLCKTLGWEDYKTILDTFENEIAEKNDIILLKRASWQIRMVPCILCMINIQLIFPRTIKFPVLLLDLRIIFTYLHGTDSLVS